MIDILEKYLILETVQQDIIDAINKHQVLYVNYKGNKKGAVKDQTIAGVRHFLPVAIGLSKKGNEIVRVYLTSRGVQTGWREHDTPWKTIRVDRIHSVIPRESPKDFWETPPPGFNPEGDRSMIQVYAVAKFGENQGKPEPTNVPLSKPPEAKEKAPEPVKPSKISQIPADAKVTLKAPAKAPAKAPTPPPAAPAKPVQPPKGKPEIKPVPPKPTEPEPTEPTENEPKPISEWFQWLNKVVNL